MRRTSRLTKRVSEESLEQKLKEVKGFWRVQRVLVILSLHKHAQTSKQLALQSNLSEIVVRKLISAYNKNGEAVFDVKGQGRKKDQLLKQKSDLKLKHSDFGSDSKSWLEPLRDFVKTLNYAGKLADIDADLSAYKALSEKVGSNRLLKDKKIAWDWLPPFDLLMKDKGFQASTKKSPDLSELKKGGDKVELLYWRRKRYYNTLNSTSA